MLATWMSISGDPTDWKAEPWIEFHIAPKEPKMSLCVIRKYNPKWVY